MPRSASIAAGAPASPRRRPRAAGTRRSSTVSASVRADRACRRSAGIRWWRWCRAPNLRPCRSSRRTNSPSGTLVVPLKTICSRKWASPRWSSPSCSEPASILRRSEAPPRRRRVAADRVAHAVGQGAEAHVRVGGEVARRLRPGQGARRGGGRAGLRRRPATRRRQGKRRARAGKCAKSWQSFSIEPRSARPNHGGARSARPLAQKSKSDQSLRVRRAWPGSTAAPRPSRRSGHGRRARAG